MDTNSTLHLPLVTPEAHHRPCQRPICHRVSTDSRQACTSCTKHMCHGMYVQIKVTTFIYIFIQRSITIKNVKLFFLIYPFLRNNYANKDW